MAEAKAVRAPQEKRRKFI